MEMPEIKLANEADRNGVLSTIVLAFAADPFMRWMLPSADIYMKYYREMIEIFNGPTINNGTCLISADLEGAAMWLAPDVEPDEDAVMTLLEGALTPEKKGVFEEIFEKMGDFHPDDDDCWHLPTIGVDPGHQNKGVGSALMKHMTQKLDENGHLGYLESSNPKNISLYQRHGFEIMGEIQVADAPVIRPMIRQRLG
jgi:ribosomal protein S18 acetylase RimI-like enzyme